MGPTQKSLRFVDRVLTRSFDTVVALGTAALGLPLYPLVAGAIRADSPGPATFRHHRLGRLGRPIVLTKFRTMVEGAPERFNADGSRIVSSTDERVTRVGRLLRGGLDELPQVLSILRGDLAVVGPRPDDLYAADLYRGAEWLKLAVTPGLTGLAAVSGRNEIPWKQRLKYDVYYAHHRSLVMDMRIVARTIAMALGRPAKTPLIPAEEIDRFASSPEALAEASEIERLFRARPRQIPVGARRAPPPVTHQGPALSATTRRPD